MGYSKTKIFNMALNNLGVSSVIQSISLDDPKAILLNNYYETARDTVLEAHEWSFATTYKSLANVIEKSLNPNFLYSFNVPADCVSPRAIIEPNTKKEVHYDVAINETGEQIILTNINPCILRYTKRIENETLFSASFANALAFYLAYQAAQVITGSANKKNTNLQDYQLMIRQAIVTDARKSQKYDQDDEDYTDYRY